MKDFRRGSERFFPRLWSYLREQIGTDDGFDDSDDPHAQGQRGQEMKVGDT